MINVNCNSQEKTTRQKSDKRQNLFYRIGFWFEMGGNWVNKETSSTKCRTTENCYTVNQGWATLLALWATIS